MEAPIKSDIISILRKTLAFLKKNDISALDELSNHTIHDASIFQDEDSITIAIVIYSIAKIVKRSEANPEHWEKVYKTIEDDLEAARFFLEKKKEDKYQIAIKNILQNIGKVDNQLKMYVEDVLDKAKIVKGSKIYEHGLSMGKAAELLGISQYELMSYVGKTKIIDQYKEEVIPAAVRIEYAKKIFRII